jgi:polyhydroxyalkanoate synthesis regulator phasin
MNKDSEDYRELDLLCGNQRSEINELTSKLELLEYECQKLRDRVRILEQQVYNGPTM